jgi:proline racemase
MKEGSNKLVLEAPGGLARVTAECRSGRVESVTVTNHPSFAGHLDAVVEVEGIGCITVDTAYGGDSFAVVDAPSLGFRLSPDEAQDLANLGVKISDAVTEQLGFYHPTNPDWQHISFCLFRTPGYFRRDTPCGRNSAWEDRSLANRHRGVGPSGVAAGAWRGGYWNHADRTFDYRLRVLRSH